MSKQNAQLVKLRGPQLDQFEQPLLEARVLDVVLELLERLVRARRGAIVLEPRFGARLFAPAGHRRHDADLVAGLNSSPDPLSEADVLTVDVDVDETAQLTRLVEQAVLQAGILGVEAVDTLGERVAIA